MSFLSDILQHPVVIFALYIIGFWNIAFPSDNWNLYIGIFIVLMTSLNLIKYIKKRNAKPARPMCGYCGYMALNERELHNHQITCEEKKAKFKEKKD